MLQAKHSEEMEAKDELIAQLQQELAESQVSFCNSSVIQMHGRRLGLDLL